MLGQAHKQVGFMDIDVLESWVGGLGLPEDSIYVGLKNANHIFRDELFADCYPPIGRRSKSPSLLLKAIILQFVHNISDRQAEASSKYDLRWKYVLGG